MECVFVVRVASAAAALRPGQLLVARAPAVLGRAPTADVVLADPTVSREHARLDVQDAGVCLTVLTAGNGTFLDAVRLLKGAQVALHPGMQLQLGGVVLEHIDIAQTQPVLQALALPTHPGVPTPTPSSQPLLRVVIRAGAPQVHLDDRLLDLVPSAARVLWTLAQHPGDVVADGALQAAASAEGNVQQLVSLVRRALRDAVEADPALVERVRALVHEATAGGRFADLADLDAAGLMRRVLASRRGQGYVLCLPSSAVVCGVASSGGSPDAP